MSASSDLLNWQPVATNTLPASGQWVLPEIAAGEMARFYRGETRP